MAAPSNAEQTQLQDMEEDEAGMEEREMESDEEGEEGMGVENSDDEDDDSSEDEKENEAEIQRLEEQVKSTNLTWHKLSFSRATSENEWTQSVISSKTKCTSAKHLVRVKTEWIASSECLNV